jgi:hypothetical protein
VTLGTVVISFPPATQSATWQARDAILRAVGLGAAAAAALLVSRRATRPLTALAAAAGAVGRGEPDATWAKSPQAPPRPWLRSSPRRDCG